MFEHECQCQNHDCKVLVKCEIVCPLKLHLCDHCAADRIGGFKAGVDARLDEIFGPVAEDE